MLFISARNFQVYDCGSAYLKSAGFIEREIPRERNACYISPTSAIYGEDRIAKEKLYNDFFISKYSTETFFESNIGTNLSFSSGM